MGRMGGAGLGYRFFCEHMTYKKEIKKDMDALKTKRVMNEMKTRVPYDNTLAKTIVKILFLIFNTNIYTCIGYRQRSFYNSSEIFD